MSKEQEATEQRDEKRTSFCLAKFRASYTIKKIGSKSILAMISNSWPGHCSIVMILAHTGIMPPVTFGVTGYFAKDRLTALTQLRSAAPTGCETAI